MLNPVTDFYLGGWFVGPWRHPNAERTLVGTVRSDVRNHERIDAVVILRLFVIDFYVLSHLLCPLLSLFVEGWIAKIKVKIERHIDSAMTIGDDNDHGGVVGCYVGPVTKVNRVALVFVP